MKTLAVLLLTAVLAAGCRPATGPSAPPPPSVAPTSPAPTATPRPALDDLPAGPPPRVAYVDRDAYVDARGRRTPLGARHGISGVVPYDGGFLVSDTRWFEMTNGLALVRDGRPVPGWFPARHCSSGTPAGDGRQVAWAAVTCPESGDTGPGHVHRSAADGSGEVLQPVADLASVVGLVGPRVVYHQPRPRGVWITDFVEPPVRIPGIDGASDVDAAHGRLIGWRGDLGRVVALDGTLLWRFDRGSLESFSPRGTRVLARRTRVLEVLDADDGSVVAALRLPFRQVLQLGWEDERHVLAVVVRAGRTTVLRLGTDGTVELATPPAPYDPNRPGYVLVG